MTQEEFFKRYTYSPSRDRIGGGGFGTVYRAKDNLLHRTVAIKVSEVKTTADGQKTFSLKDEFEALNHVPKHPNIANYEEFYSYESPQGLFDYAVMQYYPDGNLSNAIKEGMTEEQKENVAIQLLEGIGFLHQHKVVHRDLKPGNILIVRDGSKIIPLITDFGLSKAANIGDASVFTNSFGGGTPRYSSPEQLQGQPLRFNTDLWSFGAILYEVFTGQQLFSPGSGASNTAHADMEIYHKIVNGNVQSLGNMPEKWRKVAERCLAIDSEQRAKSAEELLATIKESEEATEITVTSNTKSPKPEAKPESKLEAKPEMKSEPKPLSKTSKPISVEPTPDVASAPVEEGSSDGGKSKKDLWIVLSVAAAAIVLAVLFLKPKKEEISLDTQAYNACQTVSDYRDYMRDFGRNAEYYAEAKAFVDNYVADSLSKVQQQLVQQQAEQRAQQLAQQQAHEQTAAEDRAKAVEEKENSAYQKCTTVAACDSYLKTYPQGCYVDEVKKKKTELEKLAQQNFTGSANGHEWVDLGLPSGTLWATCNIGANKPEGYGNYYAWGETSTKNSYDWTTYKYANGDYNKLTKYCGKSDYGNNGFTDNLTTLQSGDDPTIIQWGNGWRTPSSSQWRELMDNTTNKWTIKNGVKGRLFTAKNGQTLFLPAAGYRSGSELRYAGSRGAYLSNSLGINGPTSTSELYFSSDDCVTSGGRRNLGYPVRPVRQK